MIIASLGSVLPCIKRIGYISDDSQLQLKIVIPANMCILNYIQRQLFVSGPPNTAVEIYDYGMISKSSTATMQSANECGC